ncbi:gluconate 2-dehydrogenase subunit 3 family protein [Tamlana fucoidanivorans]|uniref:gluconate 2-dehydrogenase subunit 3 family protein n=1 Tax=Allotamlana fucoidanivorans TaxID=2583814 RepID=UPI0038927E3A
MNRRDAIKNIGLTLGYTATIPSAFSILQSCQTKENQWKPIFFDTDEGLVIKNLIDLMLPKTEKTPGALDVNVPEFIDLYAYKVYDQEQAAQYRIEIQSILKALPITESGVSKLKNEDYDDLLKRYLKTSKKEQQQFKKDKDITYKALVNLRNQAVWAFKTSEVIGEKCFSL